MSPSTRRLLAIGPRRPLSARLGACVAVLAVATACQAPTEPAPRARHGTTHIASAARGSTTTETPTDSAAPGVSSGSTEADATGWSGTIPWW